MVNNQLQAQLSTTLNTLLREKRIFSYFTFPNIPLFNDVPCDTFVITNDGRTFWLEAKSAKLNRVDTFNISQRQIDTNRVLQRPENHHVFLFGFYMKDETHKPQYSFVEKYDSIPRKLKSYVQANEVVEIAKVYGDNLESLTITYLGV